ncbi:ubiquitin carboxyl-terminal hydrolase 2 isoform X2 [Aplysia californica]|uniref:Ubiquitin carboxyl-terminal hydrolase n=1 Tax=Aplysia californica TaxID=6500 RepID=A0ABM1ABC2_APLCA|nr:ubiquitin carboxyl-terminal hydrolase 2 isoform X2 [Aplysia californica]
MPVSQAASRYTGLSTTFTTSYGSGTPSIPRASSANRTAYLDSYPAGSSYRSGRPLPAGPGPLDATGRKLTNYTGSSTLNSTVRRNRTPNGITMHPGPLRADHNSSFAATSNRYISETKGAYGTPTRPANRTTKTTSYFGGDEIGSRPLSGTSQPRKSNSLVDLTDLRIGSASGRNRGSSVHNERNYSPAGGHYSNTSSRNSMYRDNNNNDDIFSLASAGLDGDRPDGTSRHGYTPSVARDGSPTTRRMMVGGDRTSSPSKSSSSNHSSSASMSNMASRHRDGGKIGLKNLGNTCFMNSVLQCLSNTRLLAEWVVEEQYTSDINTTTSNMKGALIKAYASLMQSLWKEKTETSVAPNAFKTQIQKFAPRFMGYSQQDSQEFLRYLLEGLHEDVNRVTKKPVPIILDDDQLEKKNDNGKAQDYWKAYLNRDNSLIVDIFVGQLMSELKFSSCNHRSVTFDPFWDLSLPIPKVGRQVSLDDCLRLFMKEEELAAEERPMCAKCKIRRSCTKSFSIQRFPKILVLHLKRFSQERYGRKLTSVVDFPVTQLDLTDYSAEGGSGGRRILYDLYAVSNHSGGTGSGHYTAYCKNPYSNEWYYFNDSRVSKVSSNQVVSAEAYVLFYELSGGSVRGL